MASKNAHQTEMSWKEKLEARLKKSDQIADVTFVTGQNDYIAGQRDVDYLDYDLTLTEDLAGEIDEEVDEAEEDAPTVPALRAVRNWLETDIGLSLGDDWTTNDDIEDGVVQVTVAHDNRPRGSDVFSRGLPQ